MNPLVSHPGKLGDMAWALATVKALADKHGPCDLATTTHCESILPLLRRQPYLREVFVAPEWEITGSCPGLQPWEPPASVSAGRDKVFHLGMREWPAPNLFYYYARVVAQKRETLLPYVPDPGKPWLTSVPAAAGNYVAVAFNDLWAERKAELARTIFRAFPEVRFWTLLHAGSRFGHELASIWQSPNVAGIFCDPDDMAALIAGSRFLISCKTFPYVLACGLGKPCVVVEADHARHQAVFDFPYPRNIIAPWPLPNDTVVRCVAQMLERMAHS